MQENKELQLRYLEQKQQLDEIKERMKFFTKVKCNICSSREEIEIEGVVHPKEN